MGRSSGRRWGAAGTALALIAVMMSTGAASAGDRPDQAIGIPAYWSPGTEAGMAMFKELSYATPTVDIVVVNGPQSAPPRPYDPATARAIRTLHREGATVLGYVDTGYLGRTGMTTTRVNPGSTEIADWREQIRADAAAWYAMYGSAGLAGIFLDQTLSSCGADDEYVGTYGALGWEIQRRNRGAIIAINPGTSVDECYTDVADVIVIFENTYPVYQEWTPPEWVYRHPETMFWHLVHGVADIEAMRAAVALSRERNAGYVYVTSHEITPEASPWNALPAPDYWAAELRAVARPCTWPTTAP
jgi:hypothetical protein